MDSQLREAHASLRRLRCEVVPTVVELDIYRVCQFGLQRQYSRVLSEDRITKI
jgi:hypothetical protein